MMLLALRAFWLPSAIAQSADVSQATKERIVTEACCALLNQLNQIYAAVGFSLPSYLLPTHQGEFTQASNNSQPKTKSTQNSSSIEEQKQAIGQFSYEIDSFSNW